MQAEISEQDLRMRSHEIMDAVESGESFTITRDGHAIGELVPLRKPRRFVPRSAFAARSRTAPDTDLERFRSDQAAIVDGILDDPYAR